MDGWPLMSWRPLMSGHRDSMLHQLGTFSSNLFQHLQSFKSYFAVLFTMQTLENVNSSDQNSWANQTKVEVRIIPNFGGNHLCPPAILKLLIGSVWETECDWRCCCDGLIRNWKIKLWSSLVLPWSLRHSADVIYSSHLIISLFENPFSQPKSQIISR